MLGMGPTDKAFVTGALRYPENHPVVQYVEAEEKLPHYLITSEPKSTSQVNQINFPLPCKAWYTDS